jgi:two-component system CheB/CheR fusion protein
VAEQFDAEGGAQPEVVAGEARAAEAAEQVPRQVRKLVVLGASAGGLDALCRVFDNAPAASGAAFVVIQHLSPDHRTMMDTLLSRHTAMPVHLVEGDTPLLPDTVYLIPPGKHLGFDQGTLTLTPKPAHGVGLPIDEFLTAAARQWGDQIIAVILSGTGGDGSRGIVRVSEWGGHVLAQSSNSAGFDGMPRNAVATGVVDHILSPEDIGQWLGEHLGPNILEPEKSLLPDVEADTSADNVLRLVSRIAAHVRERTGLDLDQYKADMLLRRVRRRMQLLHMVSLLTYVEHLSRDMEEANQLRREVLIPVTQFFRDDEAFGVLQGGVLRDMILGQSADQPLRIWIAATATGEEAYSMAMSVREACDEAQRWPPVKIYATDVEQRYLDVASAGAYAESIEAEVSRERLERFFTRRDGRYIVRPELRSMVVFARHNLLSDPPFTQMNLVSCRNMLIYLRPPAQEVVLRRLQFALVTGGMLMLGRSETPASLQADFSVVDSRSRLFRLEQEVKPPLSTTMRTGPQPHDWSTGAPGGGARSPALAPSHMLMALQQLASLYAPPAVLIDEQGRLIQLIGDMGGLLQLRAGPPSLEITALLPPELDPLVRSILRQLGQGRGPVRSPVVSLNESTPGWGDKPLVIVGQRLVHGTASGVGAPPILLLFESVRGQTSLLEAATVIQFADPVRDHVEQLEHELAATRDTLQATIEELQTANEELQASNEELMASNEELQSTNEELQSVNEELYTINSEYQAKLELLSGLHADLDGMSRAVGIPSVFVDDQLHLLRLTREAGVLFNLREADLGRSIEDFSHRLEFPELFTELRRVMRTGASVEREVRADNGRWYLARMMPYGQMGDKQGSFKRAVATFVDLSPVKNAARMQAIIDAVPMNMAVLDFTGRITSVNEAWRVFAEANGDPGLTHTGPGQNYLTAIRSGLTGNPARDASAIEIDTALSRLLRGEIGNFEQVYPCHSPDQRRWYFMHASPLRAEGGGALVTHYNITRWVADEQEHADESTDQSVD